MTTKDKISDNWKVYGISLFLIVGIAVTGFVFTQGSIVGDKKSELNFHMIPEYSLSDSEMDLSDSYYINGDSASLGEYDIQLSDFGTRGRSEGCGVNVQVDDEEGTVIDKEVVQASSWADHGLEDKNLDAFEHNGYSFQFGNPMYMDATVYRGNFYGVNCFSTFSRISMPIDWEDIEIEMDVAENTTEQFTPVEIRVSNDWRPIIVNTSVEADVNGNTVSADPESLKVGEGKNRLSSVEVPVSENTSVSVSGSIYLDASEMDISGLSYNGQDASELERIKIGSISGDSNVVKVQESIEENSSVEDPGDGESVTRPEDGDDLETEPVSELSTVDKIKLWISENTVVAGGIVVVVALISVVVAVASSRSDRTVRGRVNRVRP